MIQPQLCDRCRPTRCKHCGQPCEPSYALTFACESCYADRQPIVTGSTLHTRLAKEFKNERSTSHQRTIPSNLYVGSGFAPPNETTINNPFLIQKSVRIKADSGNTDDIAVGRAGDALNGYRLGPGETVELSIDSMSAVGIVATNGTQAYYFLGM